MRAGQQNILCLHDGRYAPLRRLVDHAVFAENAVVYPLSPGEPANLPHGLRRLHHAVRVIGVKYGNILW